jgi:hypothetical protein
MILDRGEKVIKVPCPKDCICDASAIVDGAHGVIMSTAQESLARAQVISHKTAHPYYLVSWSQMIDGRTAAKWWTWDHALVPLGSQIPDEIYLDGV